MKQPGMLGKAAVLASSVLLVAGFVSYRAGAFDRLLGSNASPADPDIPAPARPAEEPPGTGVVADPANPPIILSGSKSGVIVLPPITAPAAAGTTTQPAVFLGGSKSIAPVFPPPTPAAPAQKTPQSPAPDRGPEAGEKK